MLPSERKPRWGIYPETDCLIRKIHIVPLNDIFGHVWANCNCEPQFAVLVGPDGFVTMRYSHTAYDGRP